MFIYMETLLLIIEKYVQIYKTMFQHLFQYNSNNVSTENWKIPYLSYKFNGALLLETKLR